VESLRCVSKIIEAGAYADPGPLCGKPISVGARVRVPAEAVEALARRPIPFE
jgi:hypothetical protein